MHVLIVDDDPIALELLRDGLSDAGHEVSSATGGKEALALLGREPVQVLITDWEMPDLDGIALCQSVRQGAVGGSYVYVILLTSHGTTAERVRGLSAGADDFMAKPFEREELLARIQAAERLLSLETRDVAIFAMAKLAESRDSETGAHLERVMNYSRILAQTLPAIGQYVDEIDGEYIRLVYSTSPLHDIGKVGIPDGVLLKPGRLDDREFAIMKMYDYLLKPIDYEELIELTEKMALQVRTKKLEQMTHKKTWNKVITLAYEKILYDMIMDYTTVHTKDQLSEELNLEDFSYVLCLSIGIIIHISH